MDNCNHLLEKEDPGRTVAEGGLQARSSPWEHVAENARKLKHRGWLGWDYVCGLSCCFCATLFHEYYHQKAPAYWSLKGWHGALSLSSCPSVLCGLRPIQLLQRAWETSSFLVSVCAKWASYPEDQSTLPSMSLLERHLPLRAKWLQQREPCVDLFLSGLVISLELSISIMELI